MSHFKMAIEIVNTEQWNLVMDEVDSHIPVIAKCSAEWCGPCKALAPKFEELAKKYEKLAVFITVDIDVLSEVADKFEVSSLPTVLIFHKGREAKRTIGGGASVLNEIESFLVSII